MGKSDDRLKGLMKALADTIGHVFNSNTEIRHALSMIEKEGYHVDLILASVTRLSTKDGNRLADMCIGDSGISDFDRSFMKKIRVRLEDDEINGINE